MAIEIFDVISNQLLTYYESKYYISIYFSKNSVWQIIHFEVNFIRFYELKKQNTFEFYQRLKEPLGDLFDFFLYEIAYEKCVCVNVIYKIDNSIKIIFKKS